jgi:hypothetical protein
MRQVARAADPVAHGSEQLVRLRQPVQEQLQHVSGQPFRLGRRLWKALFVKQRLANVRKTIEIVRSDDAGGEEH